MIMRNKTYYFDSAANTSVDKEVFKAMKPFMTKGYVGNSQAIHDYGIISSVAVENSREVIANALGFKPKEVYFTSGATESNNWVLKSLALHEIYKEINPKKHIVVSAIEHSSIIKTCQELEEWGFSVTYVKPNSRGMVTAKEIRPALRFNTLLVCVMAVNNETGVKNPINAIGIIAHRNKSLMMSDCTQLLSYGASECRLKEQNPFVDYFTFSGHKIYGPTGVGCLIVRSRAPIYPLINGGSQEFGLRGGTANVAGIVGMAKAVENISKVDYKPLYENLARYFFDKLMDKGIPFTINVVPTHKNIISLNLAHFMNDTELASTLNNYGIACSAGSACDAAATNEPSHVLLALGMNEQDINNTVRISFSKNTALKDIDALVKVIEKLFIKSKEAAHE